MSGTSVLRPAKTRKGSVCRTCGSNDRYVSTGGCADCTRSRSRAQLRDQQSRRDSYQREKNGARLTRNLTKLYGLTREEFDSLLASQGHVCAICRQTNANGRRLSVDHNHETGKVRGLLCTNCNRALGNLHDDTSLVRSALSYLEANNG